MNAAFSVCLFAVCTVLQCRSYEHVCVCVHVCTVNSTPHFVEARFVSASLSRFRYRSRVLTLPKGFKFKTIRGCSWEWANVRTVGIDDPGSKRRNVCDTGLGVWTRLMKRVFYFRTGILLPVLRCIITLRHHRWAILLEQFITILSYGAGLGRVLGSWL